MIAALTSEWIKLRTVRSHLVLVIVAVAFPLLLTGLILGFTDDTIDAELLTDSTVGAGVLSSLLLGVIGALSFSQEHAHGTLRVSLAATPRRGRFLAAKAVVTAAAAAATALVILVVNTAIGMVMASARDGDGGLVLVPAIAFVVLAVLISLFGLALGVLLRSAPLSIVILIAWPLLAEGLIGGVLSLIIDDAFQYMPMNAAINAIPVDVADPSLGRVGGLAYFAAWVGVLLGAGWLATAKRDA